MSGAAGRNAVACFVLTRNGIEIARAVLGVEPLSARARPVPVSELQRVGFAIERREPEVEYEISIGDVLLGPGSAFGPNIYWEDRQYFESTRGLVRIRLRTRKGESTGWEERAWLSVNAVPSKLGEQRYDTLVNEIRSVAAGLIFDVVSKMFRGVRYTRGLAKVASRSSHLELGNLHRLWRDISGPLDRIVANPHLRIGRDIRPLSYSGAGVLDANAAARLAARGFAPRNRNQPWPVTIPGQVLTRTGDTVEHRLILWFLRLLLHRVEECIETARKHFALIKDDRPLRDVSVGAGPTVYEEVDLPKLDRLYEAVDQGYELAAQIRRATRLPLFRGVAPQGGVIDTPVFDHLDDYYRFGRLMRRYLASSLVVLEAGESERSKATSRLYEHWVFLRLAAAFRSCGLRGESIEGVVQRLSRHRFVLDLDDDMVLTFHGDHGRVVRLRYEPWILPVEAARKRGEDLCRSAMGSAPAWRPDVLIEFVDRSEVIYAVVIDSKYSMRIHDHHWSRVEKYAQIRTVAGLRQVVRQVWLAYPGGNAGIRCRDTAVMWTECGPDRPRDEIIMGELGLRPLIAEEVGVAASDDQDPSAVAGQFATGLMRYVGFSASW